MNTQTKEKILLLNILENMNISYENVLGLYTIGSNLYDSTDEYSDLDYVIIVKDNIQSKQIESETLDLHIYNESYYKELISNCDDIALSCYFQDYPIMKYEYKTEINFRKLRESLSRKSSNSYVKAKKKLLQNDFRLAYKSMFHSFRLIEFGINIINKSKGVSTSVFYSYYDITYFENIFSRYDWEEIHKLLKPEYNSLKSDFRRLTQ